MPPSIEETATPPVRITRPASTREEEHPCHSTIVKTLAVFFVIAVYYMTGLV
ncbi:hypothetical protein ACHAC9_02415 [Massilia sp. CMS3.1]|uniref:hypothetical protein n=1 Tax=Massilia sp. CMS3.1 TaxID=3373083 RepID=UPI003EE4FD8D